LTVASGIASANGDGVEIFPMSLEYCLGWTLEKALCEVVANAFDEGNDVRFEWKDGWLEVEDCGAGTPRKAFLLGFTTKRLSTTAIGQFGEGLNMACLVAARTRTEMELITVGYIARPEGVHHQGFDCDVLQVRFTAPGRDHGTVVRVKTTEKVALGVRARFLRFDPDYTLPEEPGRLIREGKPGRVFIGGVLVKEGTKNHFSYDLPLSIKAGQNRDRSFLDDNILDQQVGLITGAITDPTIMAELIGAAVAGKASDREVRVDSRLPSLRRCLEAARPLLFGDRLVAVACYDAQANAHCEYQGYELLAKEGRFAYELKRLLSIMGVPGALDVAGNHLTKTEQVRRERVQEVVWTKPKEITAPEQANLDQAIALCARVFGSLPAGTVRVYTHTTREGTCSTSQSIGFYDPGTRRIAIIHSVLRDPVATLHVLVHELGHRRAHEDSRSGSSYDYGDRAHGFEEALVQMATLGLRWGASVGSSGPYMVGCNGENPALLAAALCRGRVADMKLTRASLARRAYVSVGVVSRLWRGLALPSLAEATAVGDVLGLDGAVLGLVLGARDVRSVWRNKKGSACSTSPIKALLAMADDVEARRPEIRPQVAQVRARLVEAVIGMTDEELYAPFLRLFETLQGADAAQTEDDGSGEGVAVAAAMAPVGAARHRGRRARPGSDEQLTLGF
jgi:transcriptional regulator with XRE-family HTH domain